MADLNAEAEAILAGVERQLTELRAILARHHPSDTGHSAPVLPILTHDGSAGVNPTADDPPSLEIS